MTAATLKARPVGATAVLGRQGFPQVTSATGGELAIVTGASQPGFNPLDLLYASLAACLAMSARIAAHELGVMDRISEITAAVSGDKAEDGPSRIGQFEIAFTIVGDLDDRTRQAIAERAENEVCTVSNTIRSDPTFTTTVSG